MGRGQSWKIGLILFMIVGSFWVLYPTFSLWRMSPEEQALNQQQDPAGWLRLQKKAIKLGLDLRGGMHVVLEVDKSKLNPNEASDAVDRAQEILRNRVDAFGVSEPLIQKQGEDRIIVELPGITDVERAQDLIGKTALLEFKLEAQPEQAPPVLDRIDRVIEAAAGRDTTAIAADTAEANPEDIFKDQADTAAGTKKTTSDTAATMAEEKPATGGDQSLPPELRVERPFSTLLRSESGASWTVIKEDVPLVDRALEIAKDEQAIPPNMQFAWGTRSDFEGSLEVEHIYLLNAQTEMTGKFLTEARPSFDQFRKPIVSLGWTREGDRKFARLTGANVKRKLAIVLDGQVESNPIIQERIPSGGQITLGNGTYEDANDLAIVLRAGSLPAPVNIIENNVIGPSLGADSIHKGFTASIIGAILVFLLIAVYYQLSGVIADFALALNVLFLMAVMGILHATLTMPGIAGIILTIGISIDSNILIFERIREEMRAGKTVRHAIDAGYQRALVVIIDSHVTTLITALALFMFGTGPVKGFAVTLFWGVAISLFTAVIVTKVVFDIRKAYKTLSI
jgi:SecD/SecF fusion protein